MKRIALAALLVVSTLALSSGQASAQYCNASSTLCLTPSAGAAQFAAAVGTTPDELATRLLSQVDGLFQLSNISSFLHDFQNAQSFASKGLGVDYASEATLAEIGATFAVASNVDRAYKPSGSYTDPPVSGGGLNLSLMGGLGLGLIGLDQVMIFGNWFKGSGTFG